MKAAFHRKVGNANEVLQIGERPVPVWARTEPLVRVAYSAVHPAGVKRRARILPATPYYEIIPHSDGSGTVVAVGAAHIWWRKSSLSIRSLTRTRRLKRARLEASF